jgi:hypothetical protein
MLQSWKKWLVVSAGFGAGFALVLASVFGADVVQAPRSTLPAARQLYQGGVRRRRTSPPERRRY